MEGKFVKMHKEMKSDMDALALEFLASLKEKDPAKRQEMMKAAEKKMKGVVDAACDSRAYHLETAKRADRIEEVERTGFDSMNYFTKTRRNNFNIPELN